MPCTRPTQSMIMAGHGEVGAPPGQRWLWEIVANGRNGIDVDKVGHVCVFVFVSSLEVGGPQLARPRLRQLLARGLSVH